MGKSDKMTSKKKSESATSDVEEKYSETLYFKKRL